jgi:hypothetical protein
MTFISSRSDEKWKFESNVILAVSNRCIPANRIRANRSNVAGLRDLWPGTRLPQAVGELRGPLKLTSKRFNDRSLLRRRAEGSCAKSEQ